MNFLVCNLFMPHGAAIPIKLINLLLVFFNYIKIPNIQQVYRQSPILFLFLTRDPLNKKLQGVNCVQRKK